MTFHGTIRVASRTRCAAYLELDIGGWAGDSGDFPNGCPRAYPPQVRRLREVIGGRAANGLDRDLAGDRAAIVRRAKELLGAWRHGNPVARWTSLEEVFRMPLRPAEQAELEYRDTYRERFQDLVEEGDWVSKNAPSTYAGYEIDDAAGGIIYVGFTAEPLAMLEKLRQRLIAPDRFQPFPVTPKYTEAELEKIEEELWSQKSLLGRLINGTSIHYITNKIEVGTQYVTRVRRLIANHYGPEAPFEVVYEAPEFLARL